MTARTERPAGAPTVRQNLFASVFGSAQALLAAQPSIAPADLAAAYLATGYALAVDPRAVDPVTARKMLTDLVAAYDADEPVSTTH